MIYYRVSPPDDSHFCTTFPIVEAELTDKLIAELKMRPALLRFARRLAEQYKEKYIGVEIHNIGVTFIPKKTEGR